MNMKEVQRFLTLRSKLWDEFHALEKQLEEIDEVRAEVDRRHSQLQNILDGSVSDLEDVEVVFEADEEDDFVPEDERNAQDDRILRNLVTHLKRNPGVSRKQLVDDFMPPFFESKDVTRLLEKGRRRGKIASKGKGRSATWEAL